MPYRPKTLSAAALVSLCACAPTPAPSATAPASAQPGSPQPALTTRTVNSDARGAGMQPDYNGEANLLRVAVTPRLPSPLPADRKIACETMLDAVATFYTAVEDDTATRDRILADLQATRTRELDHCSQTTSIRAAVCVTVRLGDQDAEYPWLLDQCSRAFPD